MPIETPTIESRKSYEIAQLDSLHAQRCPCGWTRRAFADAAGGSPASVHLVQIEEDARTHYHKTLTEIYVVLEIEGEGWLELDGERVPVKPLTAVMIHPGCRHRAIGRMKIINIPIPVFDPADEWFD
jgi:mannose-6-phosphate isomerase-like protein (cupin superfamily)